MEDIIRAVCDNFFVAILQKKLIVSVNEHDINAKTILEYTRNELFYPEQDPNEIKDSFTPLYIDTYLNQEPIVIPIEDKQKTYKFQLYLRYQEEIKRARVAIVRGIGMKIEDKKISGFVNSPFNAVMIPLTSDEDIFMKSLENESHTSLSAEHIKDRKTQLNATRFLNNITKEIKAIFEAYLKEKNPSDGKIDTSEVLYSVESSFKKELSKHISTVQLTKGNNDSTKSVVKVKRTVRRIKSRKRKKIKKKPSEILFVRF